MGFFVFMAVHLHKDKQHDVHRLVEDGGETMRQSTPTDRVGLKQNRMPLPDPIMSHGPYRPFTTDPGWSESWWWLGIPVLFAVWLLLTWRIAPAWYSKWVIP